MIRRLVEIAVVLVSAFGLGYLVWGSRIETLTTEVGFLSDVVGHQSRQIQNLVAGLPGPTTKVVTPEPPECPPAPAPPPDRDDPEKRQCVADRERLQSDLEACLFEKARLSRRTSSAAPRITPRHGTAPIEEVVEHIRGPSSR